MRLLLWQSYTGSNQIEIPSMGYAPLSRLPRARRIDSDQASPRAHVLNCSIADRLIFSQDPFFDFDGRRLPPRTSIELPPLQHATTEASNDLYLTSSVNKPREILPSLLANSPPGRSSTLPPLQRPLGPSRPRKSSVTKRGKEGYHKKKNSRGSAADWLRRIQNEERRPGNDRKAVSAEPSADFGKRWEDLIDAADQAASAAGDVDEDRTPVGHNNFVIFNEVLMM
jgi:hypothetical protein